LSYDLIASFYDAFIDPEIYDEYIKILDKYSISSSLLDIGCGTGTLSIELAKRGYHVTATDLSEEMLQIVNYRATEEQLEIEIAVYDMLDPIPGDFDVIIASMDVINHLSDLEDVAFGFTNIYDSLNPSGIFVFDILSSEYVDALDGYVEDDDEFHFHWESHKGNSEHSIVHTIELHLDDQSQEIKIYEETHDAYKYEEILLKTGFSILEKIDFPERTIFVAQKTEK